LEKIIFLSESDDSETPYPAGTSEATIDKEKEVPYTESPSTTGSFPQESPDTSLTSLLEATMVNTLSVMSSLALGCLAPPCSLTFAWVQPLVNNKKRKPSSRLAGKNFDVVTNLLGSTPSTLAKRNKKTSTIVTDAQGQQYLEVEKHKVDKAEQDLVASDLELSRIPRENLTLRV
ncbi:hypothetical protein KI387_011667, partial [Taxus chinensis]